MIKEFQSQFGKTKHTVFEGRRCSDIGRNDVIIILLNIYVCVVERTSTAAVIFDVISSFICDLQCLTGILFL